MATAVADLPRLRQRYQDEIVPALVRDFRYRNAMQVPRVEKLVVNIGLGEAIQNGRAIDAAVNDLKTITGQSPIVIRAKKSVAAFKLREGMPIGVKVTLRGRRMWEFLDKVVSVTLPRIRDFRGIDPKAFDGHGNYTLGLARAAGLPGDRLRQDRQAARARGLHRHHGTDRRRGPRPPGRLRNALPQAGTATVNRMPRASGDTPGYGVER